MSYPDFIQICIFQNSLYRNLILLLHQNKIWMKGHGRAFSLLFSILSCKVLSRTALPYNSTQGSLYEDPKSTWFSISLS